MPTLPTRKIAVVINHAFALTNFRGPLIEAMVAEGAEVYAFAPDFDERQREKVRALGATPVGYPLERSGTGIVSDVRSVAALARLLKLHRIDTALCCFIKPAIYGTVAARLAGVKVRVAMIEGLGYFFTGRPPGDRNRAVLRAAIRLIVIALLHLSLRFAHSIIFLNEDDRTFFRKKRIGTRARLEHIAGTGVNLTRILPSAPQSDPMTFLFIGRILHEKGVLELVDAARLLKPHYPSAHIRLVGPLDSNPGAISGDLVQAWVDEGLVEWTGPLDDVMPELEAASVFVLPTWREGAPRTVQEALAAGRAVITTDVPGARETIIDGEGGFIVPAHDPAALAEAMQRFLDNPQLVASMGRDARRRAEARYDERPINRQIMRILRLVAPG